MNNILDNYPHIPWTYKPNKLLMSKVILSMDKLETFNEIYRYCRDNYIEVEATASGGIPYNKQCKHVERFCIVKSCISFELIIATLDGCYRFILMNGNVKEDNTITGSTALKTIYKTAKEFNVIDIFKSKAVNKEKGLRIKEQIESPIIKVFKNEYKGQEFDNCHHIDFNSSYASRIVEKYRELRPMYEYLYEHRKDDDGYYKHCLTNSIGKMQSKSCVDIESGFRTCPYQLSEFAKIAVNGTNDKIYEYLMLLEMSGRKPLLINTDGIWYQGDIYHDKYEGQNLCQWKNDHKNCKLYIKSSGAYQYIEDGKITSVVRGHTLLDNIKPRDQWQWREIDSYQAICTYEYEKGTGVVIKWVDVM